TISSARRCVYETCHGVVPLAAGNRWLWWLPLHWVALAEPWANRRLLVCARDFAALPGYASGLVDRLVGATVLLNY
ncbi:hypothetical protein MYW52_20485, partial [Pseudomonas juntendi]|nr:hypothetical protein [Pseudomonas juntendi]